MPILRHRTHRIGLGIALLLGAIAPAQAQYTNYFTNQVYSVATLSPAAGTFNGGSFTISNPGNADISLFNAGPTALPSGSGFSSTTPTHTLNSGGTAKTITVNFSTPLTPADHIYLEDLDNSELATLMFYNGATLINPNPFQVTKLSSNFNSTFTINRNTTNIDLVAGTPTQTEPLLEIIPTTTITSLTITFTNPNSGGFAFYFARNIPTLTQSLSATTITRGRPVRLTYTLSGINNNPIYELGFTNNLPPGWQVHTVPNISSGNGTVTAPAQGSSISLASVNNSFSASAGVSSLSWAVDVSNAAGQMNSSCSGNPAAFSNRSTNYVTTASTLNNGVTPVCFTVTAPLPLELGTFTAAANGCSTVLQWETAFESKIGAYEIERSTDGNRWSRIAQVQPVNQQTPRSYRFVDESAPQGDLMYRLHIVDLSGESGYGPVAAVHSDCSVAGAAFSIAPNPARTSFSCNFERVPAAGAQIRVQLSDLAGRSMAVLSAVSRSGATAGFTLPQLPAGIYLLQASVDGHPAGAGKLIVQ